jgi:hypothetical protein
MRIDYSAITIDLVRTDTIGMIVPTSTSPVFSQGVFPQIMMLLAKSAERASSRQWLPVKAGSA